MFVFSNGISLAAAAAAILPEPFEQPWILDRALNFFHSLLARIQYRVHLLSLRHPHSFSLCDSVSVCVFCWVVLLVLFLFSSFANSCFIPFYFILYIFCVTVSPFPTRALYFFYYRHCRCRSFLLLSWLSFCICLFVFSLLVFFFFYLHQQFSPD